METANSITAMVRMYGNQGRTVSKASEVIVTPGGLDFVPVRGVGVGEFADEQRDGEADAGLPR